MIGIYQDRYDLYSHVHVDISIFESRLVLNFFLNLEKLFQFSLNMTGSGVRCPFKAVQVTHTIIKTKIAVLSYCLR